MRLNTIKAIQAAGVLLKRDNAHFMEFLRLLKLLYLADRRSLELYGTTITHDRYCAMDHGPVLSGVYDLIKGEHIDSDDWSTHFQRDGYRVRLVKNTGVGKLSRAEVDVLNEVFDRWQGVDQWDIVKELHTFPEWIKNRNPRSSKQIPMRDILEALGLADEADDIMENERINEELDRFFKKA